MLTKKDRRGAEEGLVAMRSTGYLRRHALPYYPTAYIWFIAYLWQADNFVIMAAGSEAPHFPTHYEGLYYFSICVDHKIALWFGRGG